MRYLLVFTQNLATLCEIVLDTGRSKYFVEKPCFHLHFELTDSWRMRMSNLLKIGTGSLFFSLQSFSFSSFALLAFVELSFTKGTIVVLPCAHWKGSLQSESIVMIALHSC